MSDLIFGTKVAREGKFSSCVIPKHLNMNKFLRLATLVVVVMGAHAEEEATASKPLPLELPAQPHNKPMKPTRGSNVKWTGGDNSGAHASAPRSKKYWDEHGLNENKVGWKKGEVFLHFVGL